MSRMRWSSRGLIFLGVGLSFIPARALAADIHLRFRVVEPEGEVFKVTTGGYRHDGKNDQWTLPSESAEARGKAWSRWIDLTKLDLHGRLDRSGGLAEWPCLTLTLRRVEGAPGGGGGGPIKGCLLEVQLAEEPEEAAAVITFRERSESDTIGFLLPHPLRECKGEFETGSQMADRHLAWAREAARGAPARLEKFDIITSLWGPYDPALARKGIEALKLLGFNVIGGASLELLVETGLRTYTATWHLLPDPEASVKAWEEGEGKSISRALGTEEGKLRYERTAHYVISDEIKVLDFRDTDPVKLNAWFRAYLREEGETDASLGVPIDHVEYPAKSLHERALARDADLPARKVLYRAAKFGHYWSVKQLRQTSDLVRGLLPRVKTETLPSDHAFFNAWGPPFTGMSCRCLDLFEIGAQAAVDIVSAEDWMGLNHMYGPGSTWTGAQSFEYLSAILRSGIRSEAVALRGLITPSDDLYLRLKAYSALAQGSKSFFFWTFGPTSISTENYWSDLRSAYDGIARLTRALGKAEDVLYPARPMSDPVAILYSVSHDIWHSDDPASFVEMRLTWHALRHLSIQPDFLREEDVEAGRLEKYRALFVAGQCVTRRASAAIDRWVREGGVLYLAGGAATRDEYFEPRVPPFAEAVWPEGAAAKFFKERDHAYNERADLPGIRPLTTARVKAGERSFDMKVLGCRLDLLESAGKGGPGGALSASYADGKVAAATVRHGEGWVVAAGFLPALAYSPFKAGQVTLDEVWPEDPREFFAVPLRLAEVRPVAEASVPVVGTGLLTGPAGSALVLANHAHRPVPSLRVLLRGLPPFARAVSTEGVPVKVLPSGEEGASCVELPLESTDIILFPRP